MLFIYEPIPVTCIEVVKVLQILKICVAAEVPGTLSVCYSTTRITAPNLKGLI